MADDNSPTHKVSFPGYSSPNYTMVPDELFDEQLPYLSGAELKVLLYIIRRTFGFKKNSDDISLNQLLNGITTKSGQQLDLGTGLSRSTLVAALKSLVDKNLLIAESRSSPQKGNEATNYRLNLLYPPSSKIELGGSENRTRLVRKSNPQDTVLQETVRQDTELTYKRNESDSKKINQEDPNPDEKPTTFISSGPIGEILKKRAPHQQSHIYDENRDVIRSYIDDFAREFNDRSSLKASTTRAVNLLRQSGVTIDEFIGRMYAARSITKERTATIRSQADDPNKTLPVKLKMAFWFGVLEQLLGLSEDKRQPTQTRAP